MKNLYTLLFILASISLYAQQDPLYSQYMLNPLVINPAYSGLNNNFNAMVGYRTQWAGLEGQPQTLNASVHTSLVNNKVGAGILVINDRIGNTNSTEAHATFAYKLNFEQSTFSFGMQAGIQNSAQTTAHLIFLIRAIMRSQVVSVVRELIWVWALLLKVKNILLDFQYPDCCLQPLKTETRNLIYTISIFT